MIDNKELSDSDLDDVQGASKPVPEWKYVPVRRTAMATAQTQPAETGNFSLPEVDDEVIVN